MRPWLVVFVALVLAGVALYGLVSLGPHAHDDEIDEESRRRLLQVLKEERP